jgi:hypothetical protein
VDLNRNAKYGWKHKQLRKRWAIEIARGGVNCARCGKPILPSMFWDLGHDDYANHPGIYSGPEHRRCSRGTAGNGAANVNATTGRFQRRSPAIGDTSRDW